MPVKIIPEPDIHLTQGEFERLRQEWEQSQRYTTAPCSFEVWVRGQKSREDETKIEGHYGVVRA